MPLPAIAAAARIGATALKGKGGSGGMLSMLSGGGGSTEVKPHISSIEGTIMIAIAVLIDLINILLVFLDIAFGVGTILAIVVNVTATIFIGGWLWLRTGSLPIKKALLPLVLNSLPVVRIIPFWFISVWTSLDKSSQSSTKDPRQTETDKNYPRPTKDLRQAY